ncbi:hypothetical protein FOWG_04548 [Fusarium oxysporum f. sp. lycopersici MN25]|nr:hypothetical protein FOWG_04548 [Fusarium oxysporum f. sp. lycopersici MN25]
MSRNRDVDDGECSGLTKRPRLYESSSCLEEVDSAISVAITQPIITSESCGMEGFVEQGWMDHELSFHTAPTSAEHDMDLPVLSPSILLETDDYEGGPRCEMTGTSHDVGPFEDSKTQPEFSHHSQIETTEVVCFGTVCDIIATYEQTGEEELPSSFVVYLDSASRFRTGTYKTVKGRIQPDHCSVIESLLEEESLNLHIICLLDQHHVSKKKRRLYPILPCSLNITVYGPFGLFEDIGNWFQDYDIFLQDPDICHMETKYCNPQRMSFNDFSLCPMVSEVISKSFIMTPKELPEPSDFMDILSSHVDLEETPQPSAIRAVLKRHQKQALTFMLSREEGWGFNQKYPDIWETVDTDSQRMFINTISRVCQPQEPPQFYGGIVADPMGLGKTLTMISLVAMDMELGKEMYAPFDDMPTDKPDIGATLVIVPPPILGTWEKQLHDHVDEGALNYRRHHGKLRLTDVSEMDTVNLVLTTYHTVAAEWKADRGRRESPLFSVRWKRIVLDEGHFIRNGNSNMAIAVCALEAISRWVVTGTPIQNRLGDLASLLKFIRVHPYNEPRRFETDISGLWKSGEDEEAVRRLKRLSACLLLRRAKSTINLPPRRDLVYTVDFSPEERTVYERIKQQTIVRIDEALGQEAGTRRSRGYVNMLQQIESLRLFSNLGLFYDSRHVKTGSQYLETEEWSNIAQRTFNSQRVMSSITCFQCASALGLADTLLDDTSPKTGIAQYTSCLRYICSDCVDKLRDLRQDLPCGHTPTCQSAPVSTSSIALEEIDSSAPPQLRNAAVAPPSKVRSLVDDIKLSPPSVKCVVFSTWRLTLDLIKASLDQQGINSIRFDGKVPQKDRQSVVEKFESNPNIRVMLLTLTCGAVG